MIKRKRKTSSLKTSGYLLYLLLFVCLTELHGQRKNIIFNKLTFQNGLPSNICHKVIQDSSGYIWVATSNGLVRYDGINTKVFTKANCAVTVNAIPPHSTTLNPIDDTYVRGGNYADGNFGSETTLFVKTHNSNDAFTRESLLKFDIDGIESVSVATLRLYVNYSNGSSSHTLYSVNDDTWTEMDVDYANKPSYSAAISTYAVSNTGMYIEIDVTAAIQNETDGTLSLAVVAIDETYIGYDSREAQNKPELIVVHSGLKSLVIADV